MSYEAIRRGKEAAAIVSCSTSILLPTRWNHGGLFAKSVHTLGVWPFGLDRPRCLSRQVPSTLRSKRSSSATQLSRSPPTLEELDKIAEWKDRPVVDSMDLLKKRLAGEKPLATAKEALALKNTSPATNAKILSGLGGLPPKESDANFEATINRHSWR
ncbi:MAG: hypothetical protein U0894_12530 [Pirellulales bacterium]